MAKSIEQLTAENEKLSATNIDLTSDVNTLTVKNENLSKQVEQLTAENEVLTSTVDKKSKVKTENPLDKKTFTLEKRKFSFQLAQSSIELKNGVFERFTADEVLENEAIQKHLVKALDEKKTRFIKELLK